jgi:hypothetical protein
MKRYKVKKGNHYCLHGQWMHFDKTGMIVSFTIDPKSSYKLASEYQADINKIGGITFGLGSISKPAVHQNSKSIL